MTRFERRDDALGSRQFVKGLHRRVIAAFQIVDAARVFPIAVFRSDTGIVESGAHRMHVAGLTVLVLHDVAVAAVQNTGTAKR